MDVTRAVTTAVQLSATVSTVPLKATAHIAKGAITVSDVKPRLGVQFVDARTDTTYVVPVADLSYILMDVAAYVDVRGLNPVIRDITPVIDLNSLFIGKGLVDPVTITESILLQWGRDLSDAVVAQESINVLIEILRTFVDTYQVEDSSTAGVGLNKNEVVLTHELFSLIYEKGLAEIALPIDVVSKGLRRFSADYQSSSDDRSIELGKNAQDSIEATQNLELVMHFRRIEDESVEQTDFKSIGFGKKAEDFVLNSDEAERIISKIVVDSIASVDTAVINMQINRILSDNAQADDLSLYAYEKAESDIASSLDALSVSLHFNRIFSESQISNDAFSRIVSFIRIFNEVVSSAATSGAINQNALNAIQLNESLGGDKVSIYIENPTPPSSERSWVYILDDYEDYDVLARTGPIFGMNILYGS